MRNPQNELGEYLKVLIQNLSFVKAYRNQLDIINNWRFSDRFSAIQTGSFFFLLVLNSFNNTIVKDFQLISSDIYLYDLKSKKITNLTNSPEIYEMNPSISNGDLIFDTYYTSSVFKANISSERLTNVLQV